MTNRKEIKFYLENNQILFDGMEGQLMNNNSEYLEFINRIYHIDSSQYDFIYRLYNNWAGCILLVKDNQYRYITCGSGRPIVDESFGELI